MQIDKSVVAWMLSASGAFILFLLGLGFKDVKDKLKKIDTLCLKVVQLEGTIERLEQRLDDMAKD